MWRDSWTPHVCAISLFDGDQPFIICTIYAPQDAQERQMLFNKVRRLKPTDAIILMGADFNCTINPEYDRSYHVHGPKRDVGDLRAPVNGWNFVDTLAPTMTQCHSEQAVRDFKTRHHTYRYSLPDGSLASSRIDRWYILVRNIDWVHGVEARSGAGHSDHVGVVVRMANPKQSNWMRKQKRVYPPPTAIQTTAAEICEELIAD